MFWFIFLNSNKFRIGFWFYSEEIPKWNKFRNSIQLKWINITFVKNFLP